MSFVSSNALAIQAAKHSGFSQIITTVSLHNTELVKSLGATHVIDRKKSSSEIIAEVKSITPEPLKVIYDAISEADTQAIAFELLAPGGNLALVLPSQIPAEKLKDSGKRVFMTFGSPHLPFNREFGASLYQNLTELLDSGDIKACHSAGIEPLLTFRIAKPSRVRSRRIEQGE
jgi:NADPH:quinone reductase-like Zn-dependent oxidoreductase